MGGSVGKVLECHMDKRSEVARGVDVLLRQRGGEILLVAVEKTSTDVN